MPRLDGRSCLESANVYKMSKEAVVGWYLTTIHPSLKVSVGHTVVKSIGTRLIYQAARQSDPAVVMRVVPRPKSIAALS